MDNPPQRRQRRQRRQMQVTSSPQETQPEQPTKKYDSAGFGSGFMRGLYNSGADFQALYALGAGSLGFKDTEQNIYKSIKEQEDFRPEVDSYEDAEGLGGFFKHTLDVVGEATGGSLIDIATIAAAAMTGGTAAGAAGAGRVAATEAAAAATTSLIKKAVISGAVIHAAGSRVRTDARQGKDPKLLDAALTGAGAGLGSAYLFDKFQVPAFKALENPSLSIGQKTLNAAGNFGAYGAGMEAFASLDRVGRGESTPADALYSTATAGATSAIMGGVFTAGGLGLGKAFDAVGKRFRKGTTEATAEATGATAAEVATVEATGATAAEATTAEATEATGATAAEATTAEATEATGATASEATTAEATGATAAEATTAEATGATAAEATTAEATGATAAEATTAEATGATAAEATTEHAGKYSETYHKANASEKAIYHNKVSSTLSEIPNEHKQLKNTLKHNPKETSVFLDLLPENATNKQLNVALRESGLAKKIPKGALTKDNAKYLTKFADTLKPKLNGVVSRVNAPTVSETATGVAEAGAAEAGVAEAPHQTLQGSLEAQLEETDRTSTPSEVRDPKPVAVTNDTIQSQASLFNEGTRAGEPNDLQGVTEKNRVLNKINESASQDEITYLSRKGDMQGVNLPITSAEDGSLHTATAQELKEHTESQNPVSFSLDDSANVGIADTQPIITKLDNLDKKLAKQGYVNVRGTAVKEMLNNPRISEETKGKLLQDGITYYPSEAYNEKTLTSAGYTKNNSSKLYEKSSRSTAGRPNATQEATQASRARPSQTTVGEEGLVGDRATGNQTTRQGVGSSSEATGEQAAASSEATNQRNGSQSTNQRNGSYSETAGNQATTTSNNTQPTTRKELRQQTEPANLSKTETYKLRTDDLNAIMEKPFNQLTDNDRLELGVSDEKTFRKIQKINRNKANIGGASSKNLRTQKAVLDDAVALAATHPELDLNQALQNSIEGNAQDAVIAKSAIEATENRLTPASGSDIETLSKTVRSTIERADPAVVRDIENAATAAETQYIDDYAEDALFFQEGYSTGLPDSYDVPDFVERPQEAEMPSSSSLIYDDKLNVVKLDSEAKDTMERWEQNKTFIRGTKNRDLLVAYQKLAKTFHPTLSFNVRTVPYTFKTPEGVTATANKYYLEAEQKTFPTAKKAQENADYYASQYTSDLFTVLPTQEAVQQTGLSSERDFLVNDNKTFSVVRHEKPEAVALVKKMAIKVKEALALSEKNNVSAEGHQRGLLREIEESTAPAREKAALEKNLAEVKEIKNRSTIAFRDEYGNTINMYTPDIYRLGTHLEKSSMNRPNDITPYDTFNTGLAALGEFGILPKEVIPKTTYMNKNLNLYEETPRFSNIQYQFETKAETGVMPSEKDKPVRKKYYTDNTKAIGEVSDYIKANNIKVSNVQAIKYDPNAPPLFNSYKHFLKKFDEFKNKHGVVSSAGAYLTKDGSLLNRHGEPPTGLRPRGNKTITKYRKDLAAERDKAKSMTAEFNAVKAEHYPIIKESEAKVVALSARRNAAIAKIKRLESEKTGVVTAARAPKIEREMNSAIKKANDLYAEITGLLEKRSDSHQAYTEAISKLEKQDAMVENATAKLESVKEDNYHYKETPISFDEFMSKAYLKEEPIYSGVKGTGQKKILDIMELHQILKEEKANEPFKNGRVREPVRLPENVYLKRVREDIREDAHGYGYLPEQTERKTDFARKADDFTEIKFDESIASENPIDEVTGREGAREYDPVTLQSTKGSRGRRHFDRFSPTGGNKKLRVLSDGFDENEVNAYHKIANKFSLGHNVDVITYGDYKTLSKKGYFKNDPQINEFNHSAYFEDDGKSYIVLRGKQTGSTIEKATRLFSFADGYSNIIEKKYFDELKKDHRLASPFELFEATDPTAALNPKIARINRINKDRAEQLSKNVAKYNQLKDEVMNTEVGDMVRGISDLEATPEQRAAYRKDFMNSLATDIYLDYVHSVVPKGRIKLTRMRYKNAMILLHKDLAGLAKDLPAMRKFMRNYTDENYSPFTQIEETKGNGVCRIPV